MKITKLHPPADNVPDIPAIGPDGSRYVLQDLSSLYFCEAISTRGRRYRFSIDQETKRACCVFREDSEGIFWKQISAFPALSKVAAKAVRKAPVMKA